MAGPSPSPQARPRTRLQRAVGAVSTVAGVAAATLIVVSVGITCQMIWVRAVLNESTIWQTEAVTYMMIAATLLGLPYVQHLRGHVSVDLLQQLLPPAGARALAALTALAGVAIVAVMLWYGVEMWHLAWERGWRSDTVWGVRLWIPYLALPVGFGLYLLQLLADLAAELAPPEPAPQAPSPGAEEGAQAPEEARSTGAGEAH